MAVRLLLATLIFASGLIYLPYLLSASAQQGLVRSQSEAVQGAVQTSCGKALGGIRRRVTGSKHVALTA
jgi:hypothetical protein